MLIILIRTFILYLFLLLVVRIMGKSELSKMSPFQLVIIFMIAELASIPIESPDVSLISGVAAIITLLFLQVSISFISIKSEFFKNFINGKPSVLVEKGRINEKELKNLRITINDLMEQLRIANSPSLADVDYAVMEANGSLSVIPKPNGRPLTPADMNIQKGEETMPMVVLSDGVLYDKNLIRMGYDENQLKGHLLTLGINSYKDVFMAFCDEHRKIHVYCRNKNTKMASEVVN